MLEHPALLVLDIVNVRQKYSDYTRECVTALLENIADVIPWSSYT